MAAKYGVVRNAGAVACVAATAKTILQLAIPASIRVRILGWGVFFDGAVVTATPAFVQLIASSTSGTTSATTPVQMQPVAEALQCTGGTNATVEPTVAGSNLYRAVYVHPQAAYAERFPMGQEIIMAASSWINLRVNAPANVDAIGWIDFEE